MQTIEQYADDLAAGDHGRWGSAARRVPELIGGHHLTIDLNRRVPLTQILVQTTALILYGVAAVNGEDPDHMSAIAVCN